MFESKSIYRRILSASVVGLFVAATAVQAAPTPITSWQIDLSAAGQGLAGSLQNINEITYAGLAHTHVEDVNGNQLPDVGELGVTDNLLAATSFISSGGSLIPLSNTGEILNFNFEITFDFSIATIVSSTAPDNSNFDTLAPGTIVGNTPVSGLINIYIDNLQDQIGTMASVDPVVGGAGFTDGALVATFAVAPGATGTTRFSTLDGSNDAQWTLVSAMPGVLKDSAGNDLVIGSTIAFTDANFNLDTDSNGIIDSPLPANWPAFPGGNVGSGSPVDFFATQNGSAQLAVPEPATLAIFGLSGLTMLYRRRK